GEAGGEVHYCPRAVLVHLESASRGRSDRFERSVALYRERWRDRVRRDDLSIYQEDGLLELEYAPTYPLRLTVSPLLGALDDGRREELEPLLEAYARQVSDLLAEVMRLTALAGTGGSVRSTAAVGAEVNRSRPLQAVTGACMLVRRTAFEALGGFDLGYLNSLEDVDLCLRIGEAGGEVHYCPRAVLVHLESASRGRSDRFERSVALYRERWRERVRRDDLEVYAADGLLRVEYHDTYPIRISLDPLLAVVDRGREDEIERMLEAHARQSSDLLQEVVRLTAVASGVEASGGGVPALGNGGSLDSPGFLARLRALEAEVARLQEEAAAAGGFEPGPRLGYARLVEDVRAGIEQRVPPGARVLVISRGDRELVRLREREGEHFPQDGEGDYAGHHPADAEAAIAELERLREQGAGYLAIPPTARWWLDHYEGFARHLDRRYRRLGDEGCEIYELGAVAPGEGNTMSA
ncbi:MAG TPA: glycosyltransferase, partial [Solirubrobacterales bacterium]|nr:glycosyltransferase [Solirubrobacterales bacterium]